MRKELQKIEDYRGTFTATFEKWGVKKSTTGNLSTTLLFVDVKDSTGKPVTNHLWFSFTKGFKDLGGLSVGDIVQFDARVKEYHKGFKGRTIDYKLSMPTKIRKIGHDDSKNEGREYVFYNKKGQVIR